MTKNNETFRDYRRGLKTMSKTINRVTNSSKTILLKTIMMNHQNLIHCFSEQQNIKKSDVIKLWRSRNNTNQKDTNIILSW